VRTELRHQLPIVGVCGSKVNFSIAKTCLIEHVYHIPLLMGMIVGKGTGAVSKAMI